jgi:hypothetical protein
MPSYYVVYNYNISINMLLRESFFPMSAQNFTHFAIHISGILVKYVWYKATLVVPNYVSMSLSIIIFQLLNPLFDFQRPC